MKEEFSRTGKLVGEEGVGKLSRAKVIVFGVGGVGGYCAEALARSGIGSITLVDSDVVSLSNVNRQIIALHSTVGRFKTEVMAERIKDINPDCSVSVVNRFLTPENADEFDLGDYDYAADCIDTVSSKIFLAEYCFRKGIKLISSMGAGNKLDAQGFRITDLYKTQGCPLAKVMRRELKKRGVTKLKVVASDCLPVTPVDCGCEKAEKPSENGLATGTDNIATDKKGFNGGENEKCSPISPVKRITPGSVSFVPSVAGLLVAQAIITDVLAEN